MEKRQEYFEKKRQKQMIREFIEKSEEKIRKLNDELKVEEFKLKIFKEEQENLLKD